MEEKFINPLADRGFKIIFGHDEFMREFLNDLLQPTSPIKELTFLDKEVVPKMEKEHGVIFDLYCTTEGNDHFIVEMQYEKHSNFKERTVFYMSRFIDVQDCYSTKKERQKWNYKLVPVYGIFILNFYLDGHSKRKKLRKVQLIDNLTNEVYYDKLTMYILELPQYRRIRETRCVDVIDKWLYTLTNMNRFENFPFTDEKPIFKQMEEAAQLSSLTPEERRLYDMSLDKYRTTNLALEYREKTGYKKGMRQGIKQGIKQGIEQGKLQEKHITVQKMKEAGLSTETIAEITGLSIEEIEKL
ncbi:MAG: Rpn family recombination-promoting nuclease/putative transposase [Paludibacteraceae bacterium]|nr:Rpn family recombination-promoting nuclease/putative transposase [Paludibacteraceae bacterium]